MQRNRGPTLIPPSSSNSTSRDGDSLMSLYDDALRAILLRTRASDHPSLRLSCKRICSIIDSVEFRKERSEQGYAEVRLELLSPFEQYQQSKRDEGEDPPSEEDDEFCVLYDGFGYVQEYDDHSFETNCFRVFVDGRPLHKCKTKEKHEFMLHVRLLPLRHPFWEVCDNHNQALCDLGTSFFTNKGKPTVASIKRVLAEYECISHLLYIEDFRLPFEYRSTASSVGPLLIKKMLRHFEGLYSIAMYIPFGEPQYSKEDVELANERNKVAGVPEDTSRDEELQAEEEWEERDEALLQKDMRQFFRAGFYHVDDTWILENSSYSYVFTTSRDADKPILSVEEALDRPIARKAPVRPEPRGQARELRLLVEKRAADLKDVMDEIRHSRGSPLENPGLSDNFEELTGILQEIRNYEEKLSVAMQFAPTINMEVGSIEEARNKVQALRSDLEQHLNQMRSGIQVNTTEASVAVEAKLATLKTEVREEIKSILGASEKNEHLLQLFYESDVIHVSTAMNNVLLVEILLEFLPDPKSEKYKAMNSLDRFGHTPLMIAAGVSPRLGLDECRGTMEALINLGADKNIVDASKGLSALGFFRDCRKKVEIPRIVFGFGQMSTAVKEEFSRIEALLTPDNGPTPADDALLEGSDEDESEDEFDESENELDESEDEADY